MRRGRAHVFTVFVSDKDFTVKHFVVSQDVVEHFLVKVLWGGLEGDFHAACFLLLQVDVAGI